MGNSAKSVKMGWETLLIVGGILAGLLGISTLVGTESMKSCLAALILSSFAGCVTLLPLVFKPNPSITWILATSVLRLLLMLSGSVIILLFAKVNVVWFVVWTGICYLVLLAAEIRFSLRMAKEK